MSETSADRIDHSALVHCLYALALLTSAVVTFGPAGIVLGVIILFAWGLVFDSRSRPAALLNVFLMMILIGFLLTCLLMPTVESGRAAAPRAACMNNLKQLGLALHSYHRTYGSFPPAYVADESGRPMHSWRVLLLPQLDEPGLVDAYDFNEPWDGPNNRKLLNQMPAVYACPTDLAASRDKNNTSYVVVVGPRTLFPGTNSVSIEDISDGIDSVISVVEVTNSGIPIPWMEPRDLSLNEALDLFTSTEPESAGGHRSEGFFYEYSGGRQVLAADGSGRYVAHGGDREAWRALLTIDDGGNWDDLHASSQPVGTRKLKLGNCCRFAIFVFLVLFPLPWVWLNPTSAVGGRSEMDTVVAK